MGKASLLQQDSAKSIRMMAVHIPFDIANRCTIQQRIQLCNQVILYLFPAQIQYQLIAAKAGGNTGRDNSPVGMLLIACAKQIITKIDLDGPVLCSEDPILGGAVFNERKITVSNDPGLGIHGIQGIRYLAD